MANDTTLLLSMADEPTRTAKQNTLVVGPPFCSSYTCTDIQRGHTPGVQSQGRFGKFIPNTSTAFSSESASFSLKFCVLPSVRSSKHLTMATGKGFGLVHWRFINSTNHPDPSKY